MATDVTVMGAAGTTVTIPFTSADNYVLAQIAASAFAAMADGAKFVAPGAGATVTQAAGIVSNADGASITGTGANSTVIAGGTNVAYTAAADGQRIFFSADGGTGLLSNKGFGTLFSLDAGGNASVYGTSLDATGGTATVNSWSGYLSVHSESGGLVTVNVAPGTTQGIAYSGAEGLVVNDAASDNLALTSTGRVTVNANGADVTLAGGGAFFVNTTAGNTIVNNGAGYASIGGSGAVTLAGGAFVTGPGPSLTAIGTADIINSATGVSLGLADGAAATVQAFPFTTPADTVLAAGAGSVFASGAQALILQQAAGNLSIGSGWAGQATVNAAAGATETLAYAGAVLVNASGDNLTLTGSNLVTVSASGDNTLTATGPVSLTGTGEVTLAGGSFYTGPGRVTLTGGTDHGPNLTAIGTANVINSGVGIAVTLADGAAARVQAFPFTTPADTVTALGAGSVLASGATAIVNQTGAGNLVLGEAYAGLVTVNAAAGATEALSADTTPGIALTYNLAGGTFNITGNRPTVNAAGADTLSFSGPNPAIVNAADGASLNLAGGQFYVSTAGAGAGVTFSGADTITFAAATDPVALLGAQAGSLLGGAGDANGNIFDTAGGGTFLITGNDANTGFYIIDPGATNNVLYLGTPYRTDALGTVVESYASATDLTANNIVVWGGSGSQTVFGGGNAYNYGVAFAEYGGTAGNNLLVGGREIHGGGSGDTLQAGAFTTYIQAAASNTTLIGGNGSFNGSAFPAADETLLGAGSDTFMFGTGNETITGNGGTNQYIDLNQTAAGTTITITDFTSGTDHVDLFSLSNASLSGATANVSGQTQSDTGDTLVTLSDGVTIRFQGVASVANSDFVTNVGGVQVGKIT